MPLCLRRITRHATSLLILLQFSITKKGHQKILRIEHNFFGNLWKSFFACACCAAADVDLFGPAARCVNFGRRHCRSKKISGVGGQKNFFQRFPKKFLSIVKIFWCPFLSHWKLLQNNYAATMASVTCRQIIGGGTPINKSLRCPQIGGGGMAGARLYYTQHTFSKFETIESYGQ